MNTVIPNQSTRRRTNNGIAFLSYGFRPFFFLGSILAGLIMMLWLPAFYGYIQLTSALPPLEWHIHELLYGYFSATIVGFLLTAVPNWTGRLPVSGWRLGLLAMLWLTGRAAMLFSGVIGASVAICIDISFLFAFIILIAREIIAGKNYRNLRVLGGVFVLACGNVAFLLEIQTQGFSNYGRRIGIAAVLALVILIGGRIIPSFTRNWLARENPGRLPVPFNMFDGVVMLISLIALISWILLPEHIITGWLFLIASIFQAIRLSRWAGDRTWKDRLVFILHIAYLFVPLGFLLGSLGIFGYIAQTAGIHAWTSGAFGLMTLAVMSRASLGHTGRPLRATLTTQTIYVLALSAAILRIWAALSDNNQIILTASGLCWIAAFLGFAASYAPVFLQPKR